MKPVRLLQLLMILLVAAGHCLVSAALPPVSTYNAYSNNSYNFQMKYPAAWDVEEGVMGTAVFFLSPLSGPYDQFRENVNIIVEDVSAHPGLTVDDYEIVSIDELARTITDFTIIERGRRIVSGRPARTLEFTGTQGIYQVRFLQVYTIIAGRAFVITYTAEDSQYQIYLPAVTRMIDTLSLQGVGSRV